MTKNELRALSDAAANSGPRQSGLVRGGWWWSADRPGSESHHANVVFNLVEKGYLALWCVQQIAHITEAGIEALQAELDSADYDRRNQSV